MSDPAAARHDLYTRAVEELGRGPADTLMTYLPTTTDLATRADVLAVKTDLLAMKKDIDARFDRLEKRLDRYIIATVTTFGAFALTVIAALITLIVRTT